MSISILVKVKEFTVMSYSRIWIWFTNLHTFIAFHLLTW